MRRDENILCHLQVNLVYSTERYSYARCNASVINISAERVDIKDTVKMFVSKPFSQLGNKRISNQRLRVVAGG